MEATSKQAVVFSDLHKELHRAIEKHPPLTSTHEAYAVLKEEVDELWDEIKLQSQDKGNIRKEALQVAAMAIRLIVDTLDTERAVVLEEAINRFAPEIIKNISTYASDLANAARKYPSVFPEPVVHVTAGEFNVLKMSKTITFDLGDSPFSGDYKLQGLQIKHEPNANLLRLETKGQMSIADRIANKG